MQNLAVQPISLHSWQMDTLSQCRQYLEPARTFSTGTQSSHTEATPYSVTMFGGYSLNSPTVTDVTFYVET